MSEIDRQEAMRRVAQGHTVLHGGKAYQIDRHGKKAQRVPTLPEGAEGFRLMRDPGTGELTRAGMEHVIANGGSVSHRGTIIDRVDELPDAVTLAGADESKLDAEAGRIDSEIAKLAAQRADVHRRKEEAARKAAQLADEMAQQGKDAEVVTDPNRGEGEESPAAEDQPRRSRGGRRGGFQTQQPGQHEVSEEE